jgi:hypothetical protein
MLSSDYEITLPRNEWKALSQVQFRQATDGAVQPQQTLVRLRQDDTYLYVEFDCKNNPYWKQNSYREHNSDMWNQEVFEVFIAGGSETPTRYLELEINPNNALFVGWIDNPSKLGDANRLELVPYEQARIQHAITHTTADSWSGTLRIPFSLIGPKQPTYRLNFYRIILLESQASPDWKCSVQNASFQCWSPSMSGKAPRFHRPEAFGLLRVAP